MISVRGTQLVRLQRRKSGLGFSIKGGKEHGIGVVVSWIKEGGGEASKNLHLGDEILAVNGRSLKGLSHGQVVETLKKSGQNVALLVKPNQTLEDVFTDTSQIEHKYPDIQEEPRPQGQATPPLPPGWGRKLDQKTGRMYFENHYTMCTTWTNPLTLEPIPLEKMEWNALPPGWERFLDSHGDIYYVNHHTQTTHWECPRGIRQQKLLQQLKNFLQTQKNKVKVEEEHMESKRKLILEKNQQLNHLPPLQSHDLLEEDNEEEKEGTSPSADLIDDIMMLNEEVDIHDTHLNGTRRHLETIASILYSTISDEARGKDEHQMSASLALALATNLRELHTLVKDILKLVDSISQLQRTKAPLITPLQYMLQLPTQMECAQLEERQRWIHVLPDKLTPKTNCEMKLELALTREMLHYGQALQEKLKVFRSHTLSQRGWEVEQLMEELSTLDFQPLHECCIEQDYSFQEKLDKLAVSLI